MSGSGSGPEKQPADNAGTALRLDSTNAPSRGHTEQGRSETERARREHSPAHVRRLSDFQADDGFARTASTSSNLEGKGGSGGTQIARNRSPQEWPYPKPSSPCRMFFSGCVLGGLRHRESGVPSAEPLDVAGCVRGVIRLQFRSWLRKPRILGDGARIGEHRDVPAIGMDLQQAPGDQSGGLLEQLLVVKAVAAAAHQYPSVLGPSAGGRGRTRLRPQSWWPCLASPSRRPSAVGVAIRDVGQAVAGLAGLLRRPALRPPDESHRREPSLRSRVEPAWRRDRADSPY